MKFYHASEHDIAKPDEKQHRLYSDASSTGNKALGLFANSMGEGLIIFGDNLYEFDLSANASVLEIPDDLRQPGRCASYYAGIRDLAQHIGVDAVKVTHEDDIVSLVVMNFDVIENWKHAGESC